MLSSQSVLDCSSSTSECSSGIKETDYDDPLKEKLENAAMEFLKFSPDEMKNGILLCATSFDTHEDMIAKYPEFREIEGRVPFFEPMAS